jgi:hypothetical protein
MESPEKQTGGIFQQKENGDPETEEEENGAAENQKDPQAVQRKEDEEGQADEEKQPVEAAETRNIIEVCRPAHNEEGQEHGKERQEVGKDIDG